MYILLAVFLNAISFADQVAASAEAPMATIAPYQKNPRVIACLDRNHKPADQTPKVDSHLVSDPNVGRPTCAQGSMKDLKSALANQIAACENKSLAEQQKKFRFGGCEIEMKTYCIETNQQLLTLAEKHSGDLLSFIKKARENFDVYRSDGYAKAEAKGNIPAGSTKLTGYYAPQGSELPAFANRGDIPEIQNPVPILGAPQGLEHIGDADPANCGYERNSNRPIKWCLKDNGIYRAIPTAEAIDDGALKDKSKIMGYMALDKFNTLKLEGAGEVRIKNQDGTVTHIKANYAGTNGQQGNLLTSIVNCLKETYGAGSPPITNSFAYLKWLKLDIKDALKYNGSYTFFELGGSDYYGVDHIPLIGDHVMATDPTVIPTGAVGLIQSPAANGSCTLAMTASDIGSAIRGAHDDLYMGEGPEAVRRSAKVTGAGVPFILVAKGIAGASCP